jgi:uncharacterized membrane protein YtjA (UPF0391 family)
MTRHLLSEGVPMSELPNYGNWHATCILATTACPPWVGDTQGKSQLRDDLDSSATFGNSPQEREGITMLSWAVLFFIIAMIAAVFGFGGIAAGAVGIAKILFFFFLVLFVVSLAAHALRRPLV